MSAQGTGVDPASLSLTLNNKDGRFSPRNPLSPHYGQLGRNTPARVSVPGDEAYLGLRGSGARATASAAGLPSGTTDLDVRVELTPETWSPATGADAELISRWGLAPNRGWVLALLSGGRLQFSWSADGSISNNIISTALGLAPGERAAVRVTLDVDNGASGRTTTFYKGPSLSGPWTMVGTPFVQAGTTSTFAASAPLGVGDLGFIGWVGVPDRMHGAEVRAGIGGTVAARVDWSTAEAGTTSHTDPTGRVWTLEGAAEFTRLVPIFVGEVASWPSRWAPSGQDAWVPVEGAGILRRMQQGRKALTSTLRRRIPSGSPVAYWPMEEGDSATQAYSPVPGCQPLTAPGLDWAAADTLPGSSPLPAITAGATLKAAVPAYPASTSWQLEFVYFRATEPTLLMPILELATGMSPWPRLSVRMGPGGGVTVMGISADGESSSALLTGGSGPIAGQWNRFRLTLTQDGSLVRIAVVIIPIGGAGVAWNQSFTGTVGPVRGISASYTSVLEGTAIGHLTFFNRTGVSVMDYADHGYTREAAGARALRIATEEGVQLSVLGDPVDSALMGPQRPQTLVELLHECAEADGGILMERPDALGLIYRTRTSLYSQAPALVLPYGAIAPSLEPVEDDQTVRNDLTVTRRGGGSGRAVVETGPLSVLPSERGGVGIYDEAVELNLADDVQAQPMAEWLAHLGTVDEARYPSIKVNLHQRPQLIAAVLRLRIGDLVRLTDLPLWVGDSTTDLHVMQIQHEPRPRAWTVTLVCTPASPYRVWVVGDSVLGRADTDGSELDSSAAVSATSLSVAVTAGPRWITAAPNVLANPGFETGTGGWECTRGASIGVVSWERSLVHSGTGALRVTRVHPTDTGTMNLRDMAGIVPAAAGQTWAGSAWVYAGGAATNAMRVALVWRTSGGTETYIYGAAPGTPPGSWQQLTVSAALPAGAVDVRLGIEGRSSWTVGEWWQADDIRLARTDTLTGDDLADQFPFSVTLGGEEVTVLGISGTSSPQTFTVARSVNGIAKSHDTGTPLSLTHPMRAAL
ncbi:carbohydrate binding domain-containing protein [Streptomyces anulatus]|uniref:carbohydrate binding domain-containing protein n=1 Tax=Streptomyces anulatus TaxID=1892 RepID=UPI003626A0E5